MWIDTKWYIVDDICDTREHNNVKDYEDMNSTSIKACLCRNNYQVKSEMMHLGKRKTYLTCNLGSRKDVIHLILNFVTWQNWYENIQWVQNLKHIQVFGKLVYHPHKD